MCHPFCLKNQKLVWFVLLLLVTFGCSDQGPEEPAPSPAPQTHALLCLGDSYTKGEGVAWTQNFPNQLADSLRAAGLAIRNPEVVAQTGWRTDQLQQALDGPTWRRLRDSTYAAVTLCIGVNNQYQNRPVEVFGQEFEALLDYAIARAGFDPGRVFVLSIPDWGYTPVGQGFVNPALISARIDAYNALKKSVCDSKGAVWIEVTDISRQGLSLPHLVAADGLHPSAAQYAAWVARLAPAVRAAL